MSNEKAAEDIFGFFKLPVCNFCEVQYDPYDRHTCKGNDIWPKKRPIADVNYPDFEGLPGGHTLSASPPKTEQILAQREAQYGEYRLNAEISQGIKASMRRGLKWEILKPYQRESLEMIANKLCRIVSGKADYRDSWDDIAGYATLVSKELETEKT